MPYVNLASTDSAGKNEVLKTLQFLSRGARPTTNAAGASLREITLYLQQNGHYALKPALLATLEAQVLTVLNNLITLGYVQTTAGAFRRGEAATTGYVLTHAGILPAKRARPRALRP